MIPMDDRDVELSNMLSALPYSFEQTVSIKNIRERFGEYEDKIVSVAGRISGMRKAGKLVFLDVMNSTGKIQGYFDYGKLGEEKFSAVKGYNVGDFVGITGNVFKTNPGEISINVSEYSLLAKALRTLPDKWKGLQDVETRYRKRYLDLIVNDESRDVALKRSLITKLIREYMDGKGYMEFETPVIQPLYGGADAEPFKTYTNTIKEEDYLRISNELYLKRLIIGGLDRVYEIYKAFRNEDFDSTHSPEFTMMEVYEAYTDYEGMMRLNEGLFEFLVKKLYDREFIEYQGEKISFKAPFRRIGYIDSLNEKLGLDVMSLSDEELLKLAESKGIKFEKGKRFRAHAYDKLLELLVQPECVQPTFIMDFPRETSPLSRPKRSNPKLAERFELYIEGVEISNAFSELNNPIIQRENFAAEEEKAKMGDKEAEPLDMDFVEAMEYGMPPTGGIGIGIDRLVMLLANQKSIKEVILFPIEKREKS